MSGYYLVSRRLNDPFHDLHPHSTGEPACQAFAWIDLIGMARWKESNGTPRGCVIVSERFLSSRWNWSRSRVQRFLDGLESDGRISREPQAGRKPGHIRICNYDTYQDSRATTDPQVGPRTGPRTGPKKKEVKQEEYTPEFDELWKVSRRGDKPTAFREYLKAVPAKATHADVLAARQAHVEAAREEQFVAHLQRWLKGERWLEVSGNGHRPASGALARPRL